MKKYLLISIQGTVAHISWFAIITYSLVFMGLYLTTGILSENPKDLLIVYLVSIVGSIIMGFLVPLEISLVSLCLHEKRNTKTRTGPWHALALPDHLPRVSVRAEVRITPDGKQHNALAFKRQGKRAVKRIKCVHVVITTLSLEEVEAKTDAELAVVSSEYKPVLLPMEEHYFALNSYAQGIAEWGVGAIYQTLLESPTLSVGFNDIMSAQFERVLYLLAPDVLKWVWDEIITPFLCETDFQSALSGLQKMTRATGENVLFRMAYRQLNVERAERLAERFFFPDFRTEWETVRKQTVQTFFRTGRISEWIWKRGA